MTSTLETHKELRETIRDQVGKLQEVMAKHGVARVSDSFLTDDGLAGLQGSKLFGEDGREVESAASVPGADFPAIYLGSDGLIARFEDAEDLSLREAADQVCENLSEMVYSVSGFDIVNRIDLVIPQEGAPGFQIDISPTHDTLQVVDWDMTSPADDPSPEP